MFIKNQLTVEFDPSNKEHRQVVYMFLKRRTWGSSDIRFTRDAAFGCLKDEIFTKLILWQAYQDDKKTQPSKG